MSAHAIRPIPPQKLSTSCECLDCTRQFLRHLPACLSSSDLFFKTPLSNHCKARGCRNNALFRARGSPCGSVMYQRYHKIFDISEHLGLDDGCTQRRQLSLQRESWHNGHPLALTTKSHPAINKMTVEKSSLFPVATSMIPEINRTKKCKILLLTLPVGFEPTRSKPCDISGSSCSRRLHSSHTH